MSTLTHVSPSAVLGLGLNGSQDAIGLLRDWQRQAIDLFDDYDSARHFCWRPTTTPYTRRRSISTRSTTRSSSP